MIPIIDKPAIHYIAAEVVDASLQELFIIINSGKHAIVDYFNPAAGKSPYLKEKDLQLLQDVLVKPLEMATISYLIQPEPKGLGHAIYMGRHVIDVDSYFAVLLPDDILVGNSPAIGEMAAIAEQTQSTVIAVQEVPQERISAYGSIKIKEQLSENLFEIDYIVEKPKAEDAPSNLGTVGRYILPYKIFTMLEQIKPDGKGELQLTDAIQKLIEQGEKVLAYKFPQKRFDTGTPPGWLEANIYFGLHDQNFASDINKIITKVVKEMPL